MARAHRVLDNAMLETVEVGALCSFVGSYSAMLGVAVEGCVGLTQVHATGVAARTWVGLD